MLWSEQMPPIFWQSVPCEPPSDMIFPEQSSARDWKGRRRPGEPTRLWYSLQCDRVLAVPRLAVSNQITSFSAGLQSALGLRSGDGPVIPTVKGGAPTSKHRSDGASLQNAFSLMHFCWRVSSLI